MIIDLLEYVKEIRWKSKHILDLDYEFYDEYFYEFDLEEVLNNV